jgi:hypothetical protein
MTQLKGTILKVLPKETGNGKNGKEWRRTVFVLETTDQYPKKVCFSAYGDKADAAEKLTPNTSIEVHYNPESREYNDKWYAELKAWKWEVEKNNQSEVKEKADQIIKAFDLTKEEDDSILPF